jgi:hypothetical protein
MPGLEPRSQPVVIPTELSRLLINSCIKWYVHKNSLRTSNIGDVMATDAAFYYIYIFLVKVDISDTWHFQGYPHLNKELSSGG